MQRDPNSPTFLTASLPVGFLLLILLYGLVWRPLWLEQPAMPLEVVFVLASAFAIAQLRVLGHSWEQIQDSIVQRLSRGMSEMIVAQRQIQQSVTQLAAAIAPLISTSPGRTSGRAGCTSRASMSCTTTPRCSTTRTRSARAWTSSRTTRTCRRCIPSTV